MIGGFVEDCLAGRFGAFDPAEPIYVIELGAGSGRLGYCCVEALERIDLGPVRIVYVLTDPVEKNLEFWSNHPKLRPYISSGRVDVALYEAGGADGLHLVHSGVELRAGGVVNPVVGITNYLFDVIPQDAYGVVGDTLYEEMVELVAEDPDVKPGSSDFLHRIWLAPSYRPADPARYGPVGAEVLTEVAATRRGGRRRFLFPSVGILALERLLELSPGRLLLMIAERAQQELVPVPEDAPGLVPHASRAARRHPTPVRASGEDNQTAYRPAVLYFMGIHGGSLSLPVDLDILARAAARTGGTMLRVEGRPSSVEPAAIVIGDDGKASAVRERFVSAIDDPSPDDVFLTVKLALTAEVAPLEGLLSAVRLSGYDPIAFIKCFPKLWKDLPSERSELNEEVVRMLERILQLDYPYEDKGELAGAVFALLAHLGRFDKALAHFTEWRETHEPRADVSYNMALCHLGRGDHEAAAEALDEALALDPTFLPARELKMKIESETLPTE